MTVQFVSALELATYFNGTTDLAELTPEWIAQANILLEMISADVEAAAGVPIDAYSSTVLLAGTWSRDLDLPAGPISAVSAVTLNGIALDATGYYFNDRNTLRRGVNALDLLDEDADDAGLHQQGASSRAGRGWGGPAATVAVELAGGFADPVPDFVRSLVLRIAARTFGNVGQITQETLAVYSVSYGASTNTNDGSHVTKAERKRLRKMLNRTGGTITATGR